MEGLKVADTNLVVYVHPSKAKNVSDAILSELSSLLFKFNETFDGVVLAYDVNIIGDLAKILPGIHPYFEGKVVKLGPQSIHVIVLGFSSATIIEEDIREEFKYKIVSSSSCCDVQSYKGKVVKLGPQSIHVIVLGFSSATIIEEDIREEFKYKIKHGKEVYVSRLHKHHKIKVGTIILFIVKSFDEEILHICGSLLPTNTGSARWLHANSEELSQADSTTKMLRENEGTGEMMELNKVVVDGGTFSFNADRQNEKSKRRKTSES